MHITYDLYVKRGTLLINFYQLRTKHLDKIFIRKIFNFDAAFSSIFLTHKHVTPRYHARVVKKVPILVSEIFGGAVHHAGLERITNGSRATIDERKVYIEGDLGSAG